MSNSHAPAGDTSIEQRLRSAGVIPTRQRVAIARVLLERPQHLSAEQLIARLHAHDGCRGVSKATVYNTLGLFARVGLVREVIADPSRVFFDSNTGEHHHLYDVESGTLTDIDAGQMQLSELPPIPPDLEVAGIEVIVRVRRRRP
jgi:Fur family iron response transcriptional regulator